MSKPLSEELKNLSCCIHCCFAMNYSNGNSRNECLSLSKIHLCLVILLLLSKKIKIMLEMTEKSKSACSIFPDSIERNNIF